MNKKSEISTRDEARTARSGDIRLYVDSPFYFIRPNNTDWMYMKNFNKLSDYSKITTTYDGSAYNASIISLSYLFGRFGWGKAFRERVEQRKIPSKLLARKNIDIVYTHGEPPQVEIARFPLIWFSAIVDPAMQRNYGISQDALDAQMAHFRKMLPRVTLVQVPTRGEFQRHLEVFPEAASKFVNVPFFLPHIRPLARDEIIAKHARIDKIRVLFVGNQAWRKGLDIVASAMRKLPPETSAKIELTVISRELNAAWLEGLGAKTYLGLPQEQVRDHMNRSHILVMPSRHELFGFVFVEAMAAGCALIASNWEGQRDITDDGRAGVCLSPEADAVAEALRKLTEDDRYRLELALAGRERFGERYAPEVVAKQHAEMFELAMTRTTGDT